MREGFESYFSEAVRIAALFLRTRDNYTVKTVPNGTQSIDRSTFYYTLTYNEVPNVWRIMSACGVAAQLRHDDVGIVLDLMMPVMTGWQFRALQREHPTFRTVPVVVLSALSNRLDPQHLIDLHAVACIGKPINWNQFTQVVQRYCLQ